MADKAGMHRPTVSDTAITQTRTNGDTDHDNPPPRKKPRKQRQSYNCEECRRLKMKCDRQDPCSNCVRRGRVEFCHWSSNSKTPPPRDVDNQSGQQPRQREPSKHDFQPQAAVSVLNPINGSSNFQTQDKQGSHVGIDQFSFPSNPIDHGVVQLSPSYNRTSVTPSMAAGHLYNVPTGSSGSSDPARQSIDDGKQDGSHGTLILDKGGRSKWLGPTAGSEWLKDSEAQDIPDTPTATRPSSPVIPEAQIPTQPSHLTFATAPITFPFNASAAYISTRDLLSHLPPKEEAWTLAESYYRYCAWHHDVAPKASFEKTFNRVYALSKGETMSPTVNSQEIALVFIIMAQGTMFNIEMANYDSSAEEWLHLSERALVKGDFLSNNMLAGLQTLHLMAHLHLQLDKGRHGDYAWPLWGLVMRLVQAMGMHRDGSRWNLPEDVVEERRKVFWECNAADTFQAHCFSRPCAINPEHCDTAFPSEPLNTNGEKSYSTLRFELSQISSEILNMTMRVRKPAYSDVTDLDLRLAEFERNIPFSLRCRMALLSMPSRYPQLEAAIEASPEPSRRSMTISFQQTNLALNISETVINLHRPYYAKALYDDVDQGVKSMYASSFLTVIERCALLIAIVTDIHARFPAVSIRQWNFWYHVFSSALCLGTLVLKSPGSAMGSFVLAQIDAAISLFTSLTQTGAKTPRYCRNLQWLIKLRTRVSSKISTATNAEKANPQQEANLLWRRNSEDGEEGYMELLGWRTRLIERVGQDRQTVKTIRHVATPSGSQIIDPNTSPNEGRPGVGQTAVPGPSFLLGTPQSTDDLLHEFWDPMLLQGIIEAPDDQLNPFASNIPAWWETTA